MTDDDRLAALFDTHRAYLHAVAYRILGVHADADDAVQEAWLRLARTGSDGIDDLRGWLTTVTSRICLDTLRRRAHRAEDPLGLLVDTGSTAGPEQEALLAESVGLALHVVMDTLTPAERVSFVLHDVFDVPFDTIADVLGRSTATTKMLASRARGRLRLGPPPTGDRAAARTVIDAFLAAAGRGDVPALLSVLAPDIELHAPGNVIVRGATAVATQAARFALPAATVRPALIDGVPGILVTAPDRPLTAMAFTVTGGVITSIRSRPIDPVQVA